VFTRHLNDPRVLYSKFLFSFITFFHLLNHYLKLESEPSQRHIHSSISNATRCAFNNVPDSPLAGASANNVTVDSSSPIMVIGDKSKAQLSCALPSNMRLTFNQIGCDILTFADEAGVVDLIML
jgi:hypothetical protein